MMRSFGGSFFMALEASSWVRGGRRGAIDGVAAGWMAGGYAPSCRPRSSALPDLRLGRTCGWIFSGGSPRKALVGGGVYAILGGLGYLVADSVGENIVVMRRRQQEKERGDEAPRKRDLLEGLPEWFPVRKLSAEEAEKRRRELKAEAEDEARASRERWAAQQEAAAKE